MSNFHYLQACRICGFSDLTHQLHLPPSPLANNFTDQPTEQKKYPLDLLECDWCGHCQLSIVVKPEVLFSNYLYASGPSFENHWKEYSKSIFELAKLNDGSCGEHMRSLVCDIGSNDGGLLKCFREFGCEVIGVEPAKNLAEQANQAGIPTINEFFSQHTVQEIIIRYQHSPHLITCNNCFAHIDDLQSVVRNVKRLLDPYVGLFVFEVQYVVDQLEHLDISNFYHEHLSYHSVSSLLWMFKSFGMKMITVSRNQSHNGSIRVCVANNDAHLQPDHKLIKSFISLENDLGLGCIKSILNQLELKENYASAWMGFREQIERLRKETQSQLRDSLTCGFGAAAKSTSILNAFEIGKAEVPVIIDDSPLKLGKYHPIDNIPIVSSDYLYTHKPSSCWVLASNFYDQITAKHVKYTEAGGQFLRIPN